MRGAAILLVGAALSTAGCNEAPREPVTVNQARVNIHAWNGRIADIRGWLGNCQGLDCAIYPTLAEAKAVVNDDPKSAEWLSAMNNRLSIGTAYDFDERAAPLQFQFVSIVGVLSDMCSGSNGCTDRAPDIVPLSIRAVQPTKKVN